jgi:hypothetical protein
MRSWDSSNLWRVNLVWVLHKINPKANAYWWYFIESCSLKKEVMRQGVKTKIKSMLFNQHDFIISYLCYLAWWLESSTAALRPKQQGMFAFTHVYLSVSLCLSLPPSSLSFCLLYTHTHTHTHTQTPLNNKKIKNSVISQSPSIHYKHALSWQKPSNPREISLALCCLDAICVIPRLSLEMEFVSCFRLQGWFEW